MKDERVLVSANITVLSRRYEMRVPLEFEEYIRKAETLIAKKINSLNKEYKNRDVQDKLSMILLDISMRFFECQKLALSHNTEIEEIDRELGFYLEKQGSLDNIE
jgi:cell division protein ZapA (FtsZ GTPase activity inhibitor)